MHEYILCRRHFKDDIDTPVGAGIKYRELHELHQRIYGQIATALSSRFTVPKLVECRLKSAMRLGGRQMKSTAE